MRDHDVSTWRPGPADTGQADECTRERGVLKALTDGLSEEERCARLRRALELERIAAETRRAAVSVADDDWQPSGGRPLDEVRVKVSGSPLVTMIAALNLMGIPTLLPGEAPFDVTRHMPGGVRVYLRPTGYDADVLDALSGLADDFRRSTVYLSGLRIHSDPNALFVLVAAHPAIMTAFGEFLSRKYVTEGWRLT